MSKRSRVKTKRATHHRPEVKSTTYPNGLMVISERLPGFYACSVGVWVQTGTRCEGYRIAGVSHFLEHMLFKGTKRFDPRELVDAIESVGGDFNAFTSREHTCYHLTLPCNYLERGADVLSDMMMNSSFPPAEFKREKNVILQEINMYDDTPEELAFDVFSEKVFGPRHGLGFPILGSKQTVQKLSRRQMLQYFRHYYRPENTIVTVAGDISHQKVYQAFSKLGSKAWPGRKDAVKIGKYPPAPEIQSGFWWHPKETQHSHLIWSVPGLSFASNDRIICSVLNTFLGVGMSSLLSQEIREKRGMAYSVYSIHSHFSDTGLYTVYAAVEKKHLLESAKLIEKCVAQMMRKKLTAKQLKSVKENLKGTLMVSADDIESRMGALARGKMYMGGHASVAEICRLIDKVTAVQVQALAKTLFSPKVPRSVLVLGAKPPAEFRRRYSTA